MKKDPGDHKSYFLRGAYYSRMEDYERSISDILVGIGILESVIKEERKNGDLESQSKLTENEIALLNYKLNVGILFEKANDNKNAIEYLKNVIDKCPEISQAFSYMGNAYLNLNKLEDAIFYWEKAIKYNSFLKGDSSFKIEKISKLCKNLNYPVVLIDNRDSKEYRIIKVGSLLWMAENLDFEIEGSIVYDNKSASVLTKKNYGRYYTYEQALNACPSGWRIPNEQDYEILVNNFGGLDYAGHKLLENGESGFDALLLGSSTTNRSFFSANFWIKDLINNQFPQYFRISDNGQLQNLKTLMKDLPFEFYLGQLSLYYDTVIEIGFEQANYQIGLNVRCVKDIGGVNDFNNDYIFDENDDDELPF